ncbi:MAG: phenylacetate--CoA ligase family protein [Acidimicrobiia bacterium]|nr:phenylacetate--CoA ligase family protein [Acidimicrobiia bacterium]
METDTSDGVAARRQEHVARWGELLGDRLERTQWSRATLDTHRTGALRALLAEARRGSPWHRERLAGIDVHSIIADDLGALPTMTKDDLMSHFDDIATDRRVTLEATEAHLRDLTTDRYFEGDLHVVASGGSSGQRGVSVYGWDAWVDVHLGLARHLIADLMARPDAGGTVMGLVTASNSTHMTTAVATTFANPMVEIRSFPVTLPVRTIVAGLNAAQPTSLTTYASMLGVLATEAAAGRLRIAPRRVYATSEPLLPEVREAAEAAFGEPVANVWGTSEGGVMAVGCRQATGMHVNEDLVIVEPVDEANRPVAVGERAAKVLVTNLFNPLQPLIRYELTDEAVVLDAPCACGSAHRRFADVQGRLDDVFTYGGTAIHPHVFRTVLGRHRAIAEYQVRQTPAGACILAAAAGAGDRVEVDLVTKELFEGLRQAGIPDPDVAVEVVASLERHASTGKLRRFVPLSSSRR